MREGKKKKKRIGIEKTKKNRIGIEKRKGRWKYRN